MAQLPGQLYGQQQVATENAFLPGVNVGGQTSQLSQSAIANLLAYLGRGQSASQLAGNLGQLGSQQATQGLAGLTGLCVLGTNALFGQNSPFAFGGGAGGGLLGSFGSSGGSSLADYAGTGLSASDVASLSADPNLSLAAYNAANAGGGGSGILGLIGSGIQALFGG